MQGLLVVLAPVMLMLFALAMQRLEARLGKSNPSNPREDQVEEFLLNANSEEIGALVEAGLPEALDIFDVRREKVKAASAVSEA
ncbi:hypothetical protein [Segniliparus rugosus]|uniref:Uncharacterized protein n=1 Tax=Segniliparus rugosus (strain ATCC BAA-974 / DSM 45345 / CCUG 50838 / CIP 108380 / JCM 13579 / CDC 945) TaxID=679197 RepID=E5XMV6_SEGRC|nr:hypothetical protein [Segniliparus rugosus]EFV14329.1 hypothetical protein HMPREF9336_00826 [Segniliparus rugosus ATCC BAA-974]